MAKISPVSIKYMIQANFSAEGALEKPDVIGAIFGQTEGLLGAELEMRELQKEGKIGRIEVDLQKEGKKTIGVIKIPTALDQSETTLIAAAIETIERIGPCDSQISVEKIEDIRGNKRDYIVERAKKLMQKIEGKTDSREISAEIKDAAKIAGIKEYGNSKLPAGDISGNEIIVTEGRADVLNLIRNGINNVVGMNGTKLPDEIRELSKEKEITLFIDGDRGGKLIARNVLDNADIKYIAVAPDGKEVEELAGKEILMALRKKIPAREFFPVSTEREREIIITKEEEHPQKSEITAQDKDKLKKISEENEGSGKAILLDNSLNEIKKISVKALAGSMKRIMDKPVAMVIDGTATKSIINSAEEIGCSIIVAKNFATMSDRIQMLSF